MNAILLCIILPRDARLVTTQYLSLPDFVVFPELAFTSRAFDGQHDFPKILSKHLNSIVLLGHDKSSERI